MIRRVVHHAHHADEGVYRLTFAEEREHTIHHAVENAHFDPDAPIGEDNMPAVVLEERVVSHHDHQDVVWAEDDPRWVGMTPKAIAAAQRAEVKKALAKLERAAAREAKARVDATTELPGAGDAAL